MNQVALEQLPAEVADLLNGVQRQRLVITRDGRPFALIVGVENKDEEDLELEFSPAFWRMIEERRTQGTSVSIEDIRSQLVADENRCRDQEAGAGSSQS